MKISYNIYGIVACLVVDRGDICPKKLMLNLGHALNSVVFSVQTTGVKRSRLSYIIDLFDLHFFAQFYFWFKTLTRGRLSS